MTFARLRKAFILSFVLVLIGLIPVFAMAAGPDYTAAADPAVISGFGDSVTLTIEITNNTGEQMGPITLLDSSRNPVTSFGNNGSVTLQNGETAKAQDVHAVNEKEAGAGKIIYYMAYSAVVADDVVSVEKPVEIPIAFDGTVVELKAEREIGVGAARKGDTFLIVYTLTNSGTVDIKDIKVVETATKKVETYGGPLKPGEQKKISFMVSMGGTDMLSSAEITFRANDQAQTVTVGEQVIRLGEANLSMTVSCDDDDVNIGGTANLKITFDNKGTISYHNITVSDKKLGTLLEGLSIEAGESETFYKEVTLQGPTDFELSAVMDDNTGKTGLTLNGNKLTVNAYDPDKSIHLTLNLTAEQTASPSFPFETMFTLTVTNTSNVTAKNITIYQGYQNSNDTVTLATVPELKAGKNIVIPRRISVSDPGKYRWSASCKDELGNNVIFESEILQFTTEAVATPAPTVTPKPYPAAPETVTGEQIKARYDEEYKDVLEDTEKKSWIPNILNPILLVLAAAALCLLIVSLIMRAIHAAKHASAYDHMDLIAQRDFKAEAGEKEKKEPESKEEIPQDFRKDSDFEPAVDINDDSLTIGASVESSGSGSYTVKRGTAAQQAEEAVTEAETAAEQAKETVSTAETVAEGALSKMKKRHAVKINNSEEE